MDALFLFLYPRSSCAASMFLVQGNLADKSTIHATGMLVCLSMFLVQGNLADKSTIHATGMLVCLSMYLVQGNLADKSTIHATGMLVCLSMFLVQGKVADKSTIHATLVCSSVYQCFWFKETLQTRAQYTMYATGTLFR